MVLANRLAQQQMAATRGLDDVTLQTILMRGSSKQHTWPNR
jgi:hypothetical protein